ncbi:MAG: hypothetical protein F2668_02090 [Actinobacteria bacterium]|uniref:Unannotated protein n=1 Tax=freshwater metagenome TaxID=449393 RepID=A0A6J6NVC3_9ZZZZ|nr:hypothetical protein [Actinomycetota bacterium]MSY21737.1 hypothetical protein [Actinomycetota bacterium]
MKTEQTSEQVSIAGSARRAGAVFVAIIACTGAWMVAGAGTASAQPDCEAGSSGSCYCVSIDSFTTADKCPESQGSPSTTSTTTVPATAPETTVPATTTTSVAVPSTTPSTTLPATAVLGATAQQPIVAAASPIEFTG